MNRLRCYVQHFQMDQRERKNLMENAIILLGTAMLLFILTAHPLSFLFKKLKSRAGTSNPPNFKRLICLERSHRLINLVLFFITNIMVIGAYCSLCPPSLPSQYTAETGFLMFIAFMIVIISTAINIHYLFTSKNSNLSPMKRLGEEMIYNMWLFVHMTIAFCLTTIAIIFQAAAMFISKLG